MEDFETFVPEFEYHHKNLLWYLLLVFLSLLFILIGMLTQNYTFIGLIVICAAIVLMKSRKKPEIVPFAIHDTGFYFKNKHWDFKEIKSFSIFTFEDKNYFVFVPESRMKISIKIPIEDPEILREKLNNLVTEVEYQESLTEIIIRLIGI